MHFISKSTTADNLVSSTRIQSFIILVPILIMCFIFICIEIAYFLFSIRNGTEYHISTEIIVIFGMILSHHLAIMFQRKTIPPITYTDDKGKSVSIGNESPVNTEDSSESITEK